VALVILPRPNRLPRDVVELTPDEHRGVFALVGHLRGGDTAQGRFVSSALQLTWSTWQLLEPEAWDEIWFDDVRFAGRITQVVMRVLAMPFGALYLVLVVLSANHRQHRECLADRRAAEIVGTTAMVSCLSEDLRGVHTTLNAAAIRGPSLRPVPRRRPTRIERSSSRRPVSSPARTTPIHQPV
jgi:Zn-dependent protease with chaperone function